MPTPTLLLTRARLAQLRTREGSIGEPVDVLIREGRIAEISPAGTATASGDVLDLDGRVVLPGLWDAHTHMSQWAIVRQRLDLSGARSARDAADLVIAHHRAHPGKTIVGFGFRNALWPDQPDRALFDEAIPGVAVYLSSGDLHCGWYNTVALAELGHAGHPSGLLTEEDFYRASLATPRPSAADLDVAVADAVHAAAARGIVGVVELERDSNLDNWVRRITAGTTLRVSASVYEEHLEDAIERGLRTGDAIPGTDDLVMMGPLKVITDGSLNTRTAYCVDPYPGMTGDDRFGILNVEPERLEPLLRRAGAAGIHSAVHAIGDRANKLALDAFSRAGTRGVIEHAQLLRAEDLLRFAALGVGASIQPQHALDDRDVADHHWAGRTERAFAFGALAAAGADLSMGSDAPVAPLDPWVTVAAAVHRSDDERPPWHPEHELTTAQALAASTRGSAGVRVADAADLVVLDADPLSADPAALRTMSVAATLLGGRTTWSAL